MLKNTYGFSLLELIVVMAIFVVVIGITGDAFNKLLSQSHIQGRSAQGQIAGIAGLEMLRRDLMYAGYGIPWSFQNSIIYQEAAVSAADSVIAASLASDYNDSPGNAPRGIVSGNSLPVTKTVNGSDYLVVKSALVANNSTVQKWTYINYTSPVKTGPHIWANNADNLSSTDKVLVIYPTYDSAGNFDRQLIMSSGNFSTTFNISAGSDFMNNFRPGAAYDTYYVYGIDPATVRMPFNRADYFIEKTNVPQRCAPNTGVLYKGIISQTNGSIPPQNKLPLLDCVADMQVVYDFGSGSTDDLNALPGVTPPAGVATVKDIRQNVRGIKVYILTHEGGKDRSYTYPKNPPNNTIKVGEVGVGRDFPLGDAVIGTPDWQNYRWKVYVLSVEPKNLSLQ